MRHPFHAILALALVCGAAAGGRGSTAAPAPRGTAADAFAASPSWSYALLRATSTVGDMLVVPNGDRTEILCPAGYGDAWLALAYDATTGGYEEVFVSGYLGAAVRRMAVGDVLGDSGEEVVVLLEGGTFLIYDLATKAQISTLAPAAGYPLDFAIADVDGDGEAELVVGSTTGLYVLSADGSVEWTSPGVVVDVAVAQMDDDPALEIALASGAVVDAATRQTQWSFSSSGGAEQVRTVDVEGDGKDELVVGESQVVRVFDVDQGTEKWNAVLPNSSLSSLAVGNVDDDPELEAVVGVTQDTRLFAFDLATGHSEGVIGENLIGTGVSAIAVGDADGDGTAELLWIAGYYTTGPDHVYVADWVSKSVEWESYDLVGPFVGPQIGDLDGDGRQELVVATRTGDSGYGSGRVLVFDARSHRLRGVSEPLFDGSSYEGTNALRLRDVDGDGRAEILVAGSHDYEGGIAVMEFGADDRFTTVWRLAPEITSQTFYSVDAADVDGDGRPEIVGGTGPSCSCAGTELFVFDYQTGGPEWRSGWLGNYAVTGLEIADLDGDGALEMVAMRGDNETDVFDGPTKTLEATFQEPFTALRVRDFGAGPVMVFGNANGQLVTFAHGASPGAPYVETSRRSVASGRIDGVTYDALGRAWLGVAGRLVVLGPNDTALWTSAEYYSYPYSNRFGSNVAFLPGSKKAFTAGTTDVVEFSSGTGFGATGPGVYVPATGAWFVRDAASPGAADAVFSYGPGGGAAVPLVGDWNGDGVETAGLYVPSSGFFFLKNANAPGGADLAFGFGAGGAGYVPVVGDWNGDGVDSVGLYAPSTGVFFLRNANAAGGADLTYGFGPAGAGWTPVAGDWDGDGVDTVGLYDPATSTFFLRDRHGSGGADVTFGFGPPGAGWRPLVGDWDGDGTDTVGLYAPSSGTFFLRNANAPGAGDVVFGYGPPNVTPLAGDWDGQ